MGIYIFDWARLRSVLLSNYTKRRRNGRLWETRDSILLGKWRQCICLSFFRLWKDVGTIDSLWEANMEFIDPQMELGIRDKNWQVFSKIRLLLLISLQKQVLQKIR